MLAVMFVALLRFSTENSNGKAASSTRQQTPLTEIPCTVNHPRSRWNHTGHSERRPRNQKRIPPAGGLIPGVKGYGRIQRGDDLGYDARLLEAGFEVRC